MNLTTCPLIRGLAAATVIGLAPSIIRAQSRASPLPSVVQPAEGQAVTGDLDIKVQVPAGATVRKYTIESAYWDAVRSRWVYPGTLGPDFGGANTRISSDVRVKFGSQATRWRIHLRSSDPPGSWGPWREFTWEVAPPVPERSARPPSASAPPSTPVVKGDAAVTAVQDDAVVGQIASKQAKIAELIAQCDAQIAALKKEIVLQNHKITGLKSQIIQLEADLKEHEALLAEINKQGPANSKEWLEAKLMAWAQKVVQYNNDIDVCVHQIEICKELIKNLQKEILELEQERAQLTKM